MFEQQYQLLLQHVEGWNCHSNYSLNGVPDLLEGTTPQFVYLWSPDQQHLFVHASAADREKSLKHLLEPYALTLWRSAHGDCETRFALIRSNAISSFDDLEVHWSISRADAQLMIQQMLQDAHHSQTAFDCLPIEKIKVSKKDPTKITLADFDASELHLDILKIVNPAVPEDYQDLIKKRYPLLLASGRDTND